MTALPPSYYLHVWWTRRALVASRAAVLASLLPADADREKFLHVPGIHGDPVEAKRRIAVATRRGEWLGAVAYGYLRAFGYTPTDSDRQWLAKNVANGVILLETKPADGPSEPPAGAPESRPHPATTSVTPPAGDLQGRVWTFIQEAPSRPGGGARVGEVTGAVDPWPHQARAFERLYGSWPSRLLIADEVGLGKTVQAGLLLRQAWLAGRARRILILAPKAVLGQWQIELRDRSSPRRLRKRFWTRR